VRARSGVEQSLCRPHEAVRTGAIEPEVVRETQMCERIPLARATLRGGVCHIESEEPAHRPVVAEDGRRMDVASPDLRVRRPDRLGALEGPGDVPPVEGHARSLDEGRPWIALLGHLVCFLAGASGPMDRAG